MYKSLSASVLALAMIFATPLALAGDEELCLDCHVPEEDWEGMSSEEVLATASDTSIKRHADNADFSEEALRAVVAKLLEK